MPPNHLNLPLNITKLVILSIAYFMSKIFISMNLLGFWGRQPPPSFHFRLRFFVIWASCMFVFCPILPVVCLAFYISFAPCLISRSKLILFLNLWSFLLVVALWSIFIISFGYLLSFPRFSNAFIISDGSTISIIFWNMNEQYNDYFLMMNIF